MVKATRPAQKRGVYPIAERQDTFDKHLKMSHTLTLTNGAAHYAIDFLSKGLESIDDIFAGTGLRKKLKAAKYPPKANEGEMQFEYRERIDLWLESCFGDVEVEEEERDALKRAMKTLEQKKVMANGEKALPSNDYTAELSLQLGLVKGAKKPEA